MRQFRKKKTHGLADARGLTGTESAALDPKARKALARNKAVINPESPFELRDDDDDEIIRPEQPRRMPARAPFFRLFPEDPTLPPASTAPPRLEEEGRGKRKRVHTDRYEKGVAQGDIDESQHGKPGRA
jgi:hypothetical protein